MIVERRGDDPMPQALVAAHWMTSLLDAEEDARSAETLDAYRRREGISADDGRSELDLN